MYLSIYLPILYKSLLLSVIIKVSVFEIYNSIIITCIINYYIYKTTPSYRRQLLKDVVISNADSSEISMGSYCYHHPVCSHTYCPSTSHDKSHDELHDGHMTRLINVSITTCTCTCTCIHMITQYILPHL